MKRDGEAFVGIDTAKLRNAVAVAEAGRNGEIRYLGEFDNTTEATAKLIRKLSGRHEVLHFLLRGRPHGLWSVSPDPIPEARLHRRSALPDPAPGGRAGEDEPAGCAKPGTPAVS